MTDSTTPVQDDLLGRIAAASNAGRVEDLRDLAAQLPVPKPAPSTLRIIDLAMCASKTERDVWGTTRTSEFDPAYIDHLAAQPDPMTVIERTVDEWDSATRDEPVWELSRADLVDRIRTALTEA